MWNLRLYFSGPDEGAHTATTGAVLELSQSLEREQYVVTVPVEAIASKACEVSATSEQAAYPIAQQQEALTKRLFWSSALQWVSDIVASFMAFLGLNKKES